MSPLLTYLPIYLPTYLPYLPTLPTYPTYLPYLPTYLPTLPTYLVPEAIGRSTVYCLTIPLAWCPSGLYCDSSTRGIRPETRSKRRFKISKTVDKAPLQF